MKLTFLGATREVTGSSTLVECGGRMLLVDCGLFQGTAARRKNEAAPAYDPATLDGVVVTHAHVDHSGLLPRLCALGFRGPIHATPATCDLLQVMLPDAAYLQEREAERKRIAPLYTGVQDIAPKRRPIVKDPTRIDAADVLVVESTYGNRLHRTLAATEDELAELVTAVTGAGQGNIVMPAFAVGRTQEILYVLGDLVRRGRIRAPLQVYVDSPMATRATALTGRHHRLLDSEPRALIDWQRGARDASLDVRFTESVEESKRLNAIRDGAIIISASGMCDAGRIQYHLRHNLARPECAVVFTGFQAAGTLGRRLVDGASSVRILGEEVPVRARICTLGGLSAHADRDGLLGWLEGFARSPDHTLVVHGEADTALGFARLIHARLGWVAEAPPPGRVHGPI